MTRVVAFAGAVAALLLAAGPAHADIDDGGFELAATAPSSPWTMSGSGPNPRAVCTVARCSDGDGTAGPHSGVGWAWFGGSYLEQTQVVSQPVTLPRGGETISFQLWIGQALGGGDETLNVTIDGVSVFSTTQSALAYSLGYRPVTISTTRFPPGAHTLAFNYSNPIASPLSPNPNDPLPVTTMNVDDVSLKGAPSVEILAAPHKRTKHTKARFQFVSDDAQATFRCQLDQRQPFTCASPRAFHKVKPGKHLFSVVAIAASGLTSDPATRRWKVKKARFKKGP